MKFFKVFGLVVVFGFVMSNGLMAVDTADKVVVKFSGKVIFNDGVGDDGKVNIFKADGKVVTVTGSNVVAVSRYDGKDIEVSGKLSDKGDSIEVFTFAEKLPVKISGKVIFNDGEGDDGKVNIFKADGKVVTVTGSNVVAVSGYDGKDVEVTGKLSDKGDSIEVITFAEKETAAKKEANSTTTRSQTR